MTVTWIISEVGLNRTPSLPYGMPPRYAVLVPGPTSDHSRKRGKMFFTRSLVIFTRMLLLASLLTNWTGSLMYLLGSRSGTDSRAGKDWARPQPTSRRWLMVQNSVNDNYCVNCVTGQEDFVYVSSKVDSLNPPAVLAGKKDLSVTSKR